MSRTSRWSRREDRARNRRFLARNGVLQSNPFPGDVVDDGKIRPIAEIENEILRTCRAFRDDEGRSLADENKIEILDLDDLLDFGNQDLAFGRVVLIEDAAVDQSQRRGAVKILGEIVANVPEIKFPVMKMRADRIENEPQNAHDDRDDKKRIAEPVAHQKRKDEPERRCDNNGEHALQHDPFRVRREIELKGKMIGFVQFVFYHSNSINDKQRSVNRKMFDFQAALDG